MKVSIITIAYNAADTIEETIQSVINQDHADIEYVVIDGGSKDATLEIIEKYRSEIDTLVSEPDNGVYDAMNKGISRATGDVVAILNADDIYSNSHVISDVLSVFESQNCDTVYGDLQYVNRDNPNKVFRNWVSGKYKQSNFKWGWMPPHPTFMVKRKLYNNYGTFNTELRTSADYELMLRFLYKNSVSVAYLPKVLVKMKLGGQSNASVGNRLNANKEDRKAWELNDIRPYFFTLWLKPVRKIRQFLPF